jgi:hypothetical protein
MTMHELSDKDWNLVNGYHDGALDPEEARSFKARLSAEPALAAALEDVSTVATSLAALRPATRQPDVPEQPRIANLNRRPWRRIVCGAIAATVALTLFLGPDLIRDPTAFDIHTELSAHAVPLADGTLRPVAAEKLAYAPDLNLAGLMPVVSRTMKAGSVTHYTGHNGCRLTYFRGDFGMDDRGNATGEQIASWTTPDDIRHTVVASGMDLARFNAITAYLTQRSLGAATDNVIASLSAASQTAGPCLG